MVAKRIAIEKSSKMSYLLAKIHMVAKPTFYAVITNIGYLLAKIHMVAKQAHIMEYRVHGLSSSKNPYGSKT